ncbi:MAG: tyrosine-type recombinase/integrase [Verrucomicrobiota bacterium]
MSEKQVSKTSYEKIKGFKGLYKNVTTTASGKRKEVFYVRLLWRQAGKGRSKWKSLRTDKISVAKDRAREALMRHEAEKGIVNHEMHDMTVGQLLEVYKKDVQLNPDLADGTRLSRIESAKRLIRAWPEVAHKKVSTMTKVECEAWVRHLKTAPIGKAPPGSKQTDRVLSSSSVNHSIAAMGLLMQFAISRGVRADNPAEKMPRAKEQTQKKVDLPSVEEMDRLLIELEYPRPEKIISIAGAKGTTQLEQAESLGMSLATYKRHLKKNEEGPKAKTAGEGRNKDTGDCARLLMYTGIRIGEARRLQWKHVNWTRNQLHIPGTKSEAADRIAPLVPEARAFLEKLFEDNKPSLGDPILRRKDILKAITASCERLGIARLTHHDFRHYFITTCVESGVDFKTIAEWVGHSDGGILIGKVYGHLRDQHSQESAAKVSFGAKKRGTVVDFRAG